MFVMTEDGKQIIQVRSLAVIRNIGSKQGKYAITVGGQNAALETPILSNWPDEESAKAELKKVWDAMCEGREFYRTEKSL